METTLDELLYAIRTSLTEAQETIRSRYEDTGIQENRASLPRVSQLSLTCDCKLRNIIPFIPSRGCCLELITKDSRKERQYLFRNNPPRKIQILFSGSQNPVGEVRFAGRTLAILPWEYEPTDKDTTFSFFSSSLGIWERILRSFGPKGILLNIMQSQTARQIMQEKNSTDAQLNTHGGPNEQ